MEKPRVAKRVEVQLGDQTVPVELDENGNIIRPYSQVFDFAMTVSMEAMYMDYLKCHMYFTTTCGEPYDPKDRTRFFHDYGTLSSAVFDKMNAEGCWEPPFDRGLRMGLVAEAAKMPNNPNTLPALRDPTERGN